MPALQIEARAKYDAWNGLKGMPREEAMSKYIDHVQSGDPQWEDHPVLKNM